MCVVGDEMQSIYGFRYADVEIFRERRRDLVASGAHVELRGNFRCAPRSSASSSRTGGRDLNDLPPQQGMRDPLEGPPAVELLVVGKKGTGTKRPGLGRRPPASDDLAPCRGAVMLAQRIASLVEDQGYSPGDIAVLLRAGTNSRLYEVALQRAGLNTVASTGDFWSHEQVVDLLAMLRAVANPADEHALYSMLASPLGALDSDSLMTLSRPRGQAARRGYGRRCTTPGRSERLGDQADRRGGRRGAGRQVALARTDELDRRADRVRGARRRLPDPRADALTTVRGGSPTSTS